MAFRAMARELPRWIMGLTWLGLGASELGAAEAQLSLRELGLRLLVPPA